MRKMKRILESFDLGEPVTPICPEDGTPFRRTLRPFEFEGESFGYFPVDVCENGHEYFTEESRHGIQEISKAKGLWGSGDIPTLQPPYAITRTITIRAHESNFRSKGETPTITHTFTVPIRSTESKIDARDRAINAPAATVTVPP